MADDNRTSEYAKLGISLTEWMGNDRRIICYPCADGEMLNLVAIVPSKEVEASAIEAESPQEEKKGMLKSFETFGDGAKAVLEQAPEEDLKVWPLLDMEPLEKWSEGRLALIGDACHPFTPCECTRSKVERLSADKTVGLEVQFDLGLRQLAQGPTTAPIYNIRGLPNLRLEPPFSIYVVY
ncbi:hypothetical protein CCUS01_06760 [Colletotrichum cuscutae]|uniref:FAD-binding domain-containing protein n=1 Tax=Colletotrichum cuscutae TaxID=1209917 RepID=A0AAI9V259_9PEZI|nr:hypothetical protein CCUS01_06760 [Colletotrichum cuscutae]